MELKDRLNGNAEKTAQIQTQPLSLKNQEIKFREKTGEEFTKFYSTYLPKLIYYTSRLCNDSALAEDISIDSFMVALEKIDKYNPEKARFSTWLFTIARNLTFQKMNERKRFISMDSTIDEEGTTIKDFLYDPEIDDRVENEAQQLSIKKAEILKDNIQKLKQPYRTVIEMRELKKMPYKDIADQLDLNLSTLKSQIRNGRILLRKMVKKQFDILDDMYQ